MKNPALVIPEALQALQALGKAAMIQGAHAKATALAQLRASQINGCSVCVDMHARMMKNSGESDERLFAVSAWRDSPLFTGAERAALALAEAITRLADQPEPVSDAVWEEAARQYDERELAALIIGIVAINAFNRINASTRQVAGEWIRSVDPEEIKRRGCPATEREREGAEPLRPGGVRSIASAARTATAPLPLVGSGTVQLAGSPDAQ